jgi:D-glycero-alpha-D-manno-heptose 1-phosphate guanylyltransferase
MASFSPGTNKTLRTSGKKEGVNEAIVLAGGLGTRLKDLLPDLPKCMAPVAGRPFLFYVVNYLRSQGIEKFIFSLGYKHDQILEWLQTQFPTLNYRYVIEEKPLGTGGAIRLATTTAESENLLIANGDTLFRADILKAEAIHFNKKAACTLLLKPMQDFDRYGVVEINAEKEVTGFREKQVYERGNINGGLYLLNRERFLKQEFPEVFSFETEYLEKTFRSNKIYGIVDENYFIDIGIPQDFQKAQADLAPPPLSLKSFNRNWNLFIDRDGVINHDTKDDYIRNWKLFRFYDGVPEALKKLSGLFGRIIIISNQRGVERGLMTEEDLQDIHRKMHGELLAAGARVDHIYYCTARDEKDPFRKPNPGMAFGAKKDFPDIEFSRSLMIGNKLSDMLFARNAGMYSIFLATTDPDTPFPHPDIDLRFSSLTDFANSL